MKQPETKAASARGLFHATGKTSRPVQVRHDDGSYGKADALERKEDDFYPTPPEPIRSLIHAEGARLRRFKRIWDGSVGDGALTREMEAAGLETFGSDLVDRGVGAEIKSFYDYTRATRPSEATIQNPPFQECSWGHGKARWMIHALEVLELEYMALLLPWQFPGAAGMAAFWAAHPPARVYLMRWRIDFTGQGASPMLNAWWIWDAEHQGDTALYMLDQIDTRQPALF